MIEYCLCVCILSPTVPLTILHTERPKLYTILAFLSAIGLMVKGDTVPLMVTGATIYFIPSSESSAYLKQIKCILSAVKKYRIFSLVTDTIFIFSL